MNYNNTTSNNIVDILHADTKSNQTHHGLGGSNSSRTKDDDYEFNLSFEEDFFLDLQKGGIDLD